MLQRMRELAVQASNNSLISNDRQYIQLEIDELKKQIDRIAGTTQFNKKRILDGSSGANWSSNDMNVKAKINGGLTYVDEFGQKVSGEGNYRIEITADGGQAQVQKSNIINVSTIEFIHEAIEVVGEGHNYDDIDIAVEEFSGTVSGSGWSFEDGILTINASGSFHIYGTNAQTSNHVVISSGIDADVLLENINICATSYATSSFAAFEIESSAKVDLFLAGNNHRRQ